MSQHEIYMKEALLEAKEALAAGEFPVGCVLVYEKKLSAGEEDSIPGPPMKMNWTMQKLWPCGNFLHSIQRSNAPE